MSTKEMQDKIAENMQKWMRIEDASVASTGRIMEQTENPFLRLVMDIIQCDSRVHHHVQDFIRGTLKHEAVSLTPEELALVWAAIEKHNEIEKKMVGLVESTLQALKGRKMIVQEYLLNYLVQDERKHAGMLDALEKIKGGLYPYA